MIFLVILFILKKISLKKLKKLDFLLRFAQKIKKHSKSNLGQLQTKYHFIKYQETVLKAYLNKYLYFL